MGQVTHASKQHHVFHFEAALPIRSNTLVSPECEAEGERNEWTKKKCRPIKGHRWSNYIDPDVDRERSQSLSYDDDDDDRDGDDTNDAQPQRRRRKSSIERRAMSSQTPDSIPDVAKSRSTSIEAQRQASSRELIVKATNTKAPLPSPSPAKGAGLLLPEEQRSATYTQGCPPGYTHNDYCSSSSLQIYVRRDNFRPRKCIGVPETSVPMTEKVSKMIWYRGFNHSYSFDPGSLQNIFNIAMLRAQRRAIIAQTPLHDAFQAAMLEAIRLSKTFECREKYIVWWSAVYADFYIMNGRERSVLANRVMKIRGLHVDAKIAEFLDKDANATSTGPTVKLHIGTDMPKDMISYKKRADRSTVEEIDELVKTRRAQIMTGKDETCSPWFEEAMATIADEELAYCVIVKGKAFYS